MMDYAFKMVDSLLKMMAITSAAATLTYPITTQVRNLF